MKLYHYVSTCNYLSFIDLFLRLIFDIATIEYTKAKFIKF